MATEQARSTEVATRGILLRQVKHSLEDQCLLFSGMSLMSLSNTVSRVHHLFTISLNWAKRITQSL